MSAGWPLKEGWKRTSRDGDPGRAEAKAPEKTVCILQPGYLPWLGFFHQMSRSDIFVLYDDVQYDKHGWRNRNRIKSANGPQWMTVPVRHKGLGLPRLVDVEIDNQTAWGRKHLASIRQAYAKAPYLNRYLPELEEVYRTKWMRLVDLDMRIIQLLSRWLDVGSRMVRSSELSISGERSERLVRICQYFGATRYLSGPSAQAYLNTHLFAQEGIEVEWHAYRHPVYAQLHGEFVPQMSTLDLLLNCGKESKAIVISGGGRDHGGSKEMP